MRESKIYSPIEKKDMIMNLQGSRGVRLRIFATGKNKRRNLESVVVFDLKELIENLKILTK